MYDQFYQKYGIEIDHWVPIYTEKDVETTINSIQEVNLA